MRPALLFLLVFFAHTAGFGQNLTFDHLQKDLLVPRNQLKTVPLDPNNPLNLSATVAQLFKIQKIKGNSFRFNCDSLKALAQKENRIDLQAHIVYLHALQLIAQNNLEDAFKTLNEAMPLYKNYQDITGLVFTYSKLSELYLKQAANELRNIEVGLDYATKAVSLADQAESKLAKIQAKAQLCNAYGFKRDWTTAEALANEVLKLIGQNTLFLEYEGRMRNNLARFYLFQGSPQRAYNEMTQINTINQTYLSDFDYLSFLVNFAILGLKLNKLDEAQKHLEYVVEQAKTPNLALVRQGAFEKLSELFRLKSDYKTALVSADSNLAVQSNIYAQSNMEKLNALEAKYKNKEITQNNKYLSLENDLVKSQNQSLLGLVALSVIFVGILSWISYKLFKSKQVVQQQSQEIVRLAQVRDYYFRIVAHDLRSPIMALENVYESLRFAIQANNTQNLNRISDYLKQTGMKTKHLFDNLIHWGLTESQEIPYAPSAVPLKALVEEVADYFFPVYATRGIQITIEIQEDMVVWVDRQGLTLILRNLLDNALKHLSGAEKAVFFVGTYTAEGQAVLKIRDTGQGMETPQVAAVQRLVQDSSQALVDHGSLGMGLPLVVRFSRRNQIQLTLESALELGTEFGLILPSPAPSSSV